VALLQKRRPDETDNVVSGNPVGGVYVQVVKKIPASFGAGIFSWRIFFLFLPASWREVRWGFMESTRYQLHE
jgi:hypothetical protein